MSGFIEAVRRALADADPRDLQWIEWGALLFAAEAATALVAIGMAVLL